MSRSARKVLQLLLDHRFGENDGWMWGYQVQKETELPVGAVYAALHKLLHEGWLEDKQVPINVGTPRERLRIYYRIKLDRRASAASRPARASAGPSMHRTPVFLP